MPAAAIHALTHRAYVAGCRALAASRPLEVVLSLDPPTRIV
jgi:hypothetical protein